MKTILLSAGLFVITNAASAQTTYSLQAVGEGNFGTPNGDVFNISLTGTAVTVSGALYQTANSTTIGIDVLQDFEVVGNKAILLSKPFSSPAIVIANYPSFANIATFTASGFPQSVVRASHTKAYVSATNPDAILQINMTGNSIAAVSDPSASISGTADYMVATNGFVYAAIGSKIIKIDTAASAVVGAINPGLGNIDGMVLDTLGQDIWILGKTGGTPSVVKMEVALSDLLNPPVVFTGITTAGYLRFCNNKLYFLSNKSVYTYNLATLTVPSTPVYTSTLSGSWDFAYGKSFFVENITGNLVLGSANAFTGPSLFEIVDGSSYTVAATGSITGCMGVNEFALKTIVSTPTGIQPAQASFISALFPNPANETATLNVSDAQAGYVVTITNQLGQEILKQAFTGGQCQLQLHTINTGMYRVDVQQQGSTQRASQRLIVNH